MSSKQEKFLGIAADISAALPDTSAATASLVMGVISTALIALAVVVIAIALILHCAHH